MLTADVAVIGGGPAGLVAAGKAAASGATVLLLEGEEKAGQKLLLTGKGRCNLTNTLAVDDFLARYGRNGRFLRNAFHHFFSTELVEFLEDCGVKTAVERGGRIYPAEGGAQSVLRALLRFARTSGVTVETGKRVKSIVSVPGGTFVLGGKDFRRNARRVILATGGASYPQTGSRGDGYAMAAAMGHTLKPLHPALVPVRCSDRFLPRLAGLRLRNVRLTVTPRRGRHRDCFGEVHFTRFGVSGPAVFILSKGIGEECTEGPVPLRLDFKPALDEARLEARLVREFDGKGKETLETVMKRLLPGVMVPVFLESVEAPANLSSGEVTKALRKKIVLFLKAFPLSATGTLPLERAMVTAGGIHLPEIHPVTMESKIVPGLHFCGEIMDIDGDTGGFNLQAAFSTGWLAGGSAGTVFGKGSGR